jgi:hypothetical protein
LSQLLLGGALGRNVTILGRTQVRLEILTVLLCPGWR